MHFYIYNASAGSGKTYTLVKEYLKMAMASQDSDSFRRILAMTFTNKAASEMKERVLNVLEKIHADDPGVQELIETLQSETHQKKEQIQKRAHEMLRSILHNYADFSIGTIDSFMHRVVRTFAYDLHLPVTFSVELNKENLILQAIDELIDMAGQHPEITAILKGFTEFKTNEEKGFEIRKELQEVAQDLLDDQKADAIRLLGELQPSFFIELRNSFRAKMHDYEKSIRTEGKRILTRLKELDIEPAELAYGDKGIYSFFKKASTFGESYFDKLEVGKNAQKSIESDKWTSSNCRPESAHQIKSIVPELISVMEKILETEQTTGAHYRLLSLIADSLFPMALMREVAAIIDKIREDQHLLHISEFNRRVAEIVFHEPAPFIFERLGEKYHHYLIDEFQDTSVLQWQNLLPLIQNGLSTQSASLIVGDGKQAIYRFRGGDVEQFIRLPEPYPSDLSSFQLERYTLLRMMQKKLPLETNYRSLPTITQWNNSFYQTLSNQWLTGDFQQVYSNLDQKSPASKKGGYVQVEFLADYPEEDEEVSIECLRIIRLVQKLRQEKSYRFSDIAILTRSNLKGSLIANYLIANEIPVISNESLLVASSPEVQVLVAWLRVLADQNSSVHLLHVCSYLISKNKLPVASIPELVKLIRMEETEVIPYLAQCGYHFSLPELRAQSLPETCHTLCRIMDFGLQKNPFLQFFLEAVWFATDQITPDIPTFLEYWDEQKTKLSITLPQNADAIRIMTIHKSKGLQFPVVIFPFADNDKRYQSFEWVTDSSRLPEGLPSARLPISKKLSNTIFADLVELEDNRHNLDLINLLYVATTRPEDALYILSKEEKVTGQAGWGTFLSQFVAQNTLWKRDRNAFYWGDPHYTNQRQGKPGDNAQKNVESYSISPWQEKIKIHREANLFWDAEEESEAIKQGKLVHKALSWIKTENDIQAAQYQLIESGLCSKDVSEVVAQQLKKVFQIPEISAYFKSGIRIFAERALLLPDGKTYRPDRVVVCEGETVVLEYKTGKENPAHAKQVKRYMEILSSMGHDRISAYLIYLNESPSAQKIAS